MSFRKRLLLLFALTIALVVALSSSVVWVMLRRSFERANEESAEGLTAQFRGEFTRRGEEVSRRVAAVASGETAGRIALELNRGGADRGLYVDTAGELAAGQHLDFLELIDDQGVIVSSAQWPAKFGYKKTDVAWSAGGAFLRREEVADGVQLGLFSLRAVRVGEKPLYVFGGQKLGSGFLASLELPPGLRVLLYPNVERDFTAGRLVDARGPVKDGDRLGELVRLVQSSGQEAGGVVQWSGDGADAESFRALPLNGAGADAKSELLGVLLVGSARRPLVELQRRVVSASLLVGGVGLLLAILMSSWLAARVSQPLVALADGARRVAAGDWETRVPVSSRDELGELAGAFNRMTGELRAQRDHLVQAERVAAWRELARRLAHELKNPLFPLQVTVENLVRARGMAEFDEVFQESTGTLLAELGNLKAIIGRFSEFSRMPQPQRSLVSVNDVVRGVEKLHAAQLAAAGIAVEMVLGEVPLVSADAELLHRAVSNLVLNAVDAMPSGGKLRLGTCSVATGVEISVSDNGTGMSKEEAERLFTPYYTTKQHGTGLGLAIVQSVVSDHGGDVSVESSASGTTFRIRLPLGGVNV